VLEADLLALTLPSVDSTKLIRINLLTRNFKIELD